MNVEINSIYDIGKYYGWKDGKREGKQEGIREGKQEGIREGKREGIREGKREGIREGKREGDQERLRTMLKQCLTLRFPQMAQTTINAVMSISDPSVLESIFKVACTVDSLDRFQRDVRGIAPIN